MCIRLRVAARVLFVFAAGTPWVSAAETWFDRLPEEARQEVLWRSDFEAGDLSDWTRPGAKHPGAGVFNTGGRDATARAVRTLAHSGAWSVRTDIQHAVGGRNGTRAVRLMAWTDRPWDLGGMEFPIDAWYSVWMLIPHPYRPERHSADGGWWNVFQFKCEDAAGESQPTWVVNVASAPAGKLVLYLYSPINSPATYEAPTPRLFAPNEWVHLEAHYHAAPRGGLIELYQDGVLTIAARDVATSLGGARNGSVQTAAKTDAANGDASNDQPHAIWGIGNYTDHIVGDPAGDGRATVYFDDAAVSHVRLGAFTDRADSSSVSKEPPDNAP